MSSSVRATRVQFDPDSMWVNLSDERTLGVPLAWFPRLLHGTAEQREQVRISNRGLHWEALDEDISVAGLLAGLGIGRWAGRSLQLRALLRLEAEDVMPARMGFGWAVAVFGRGA